MEFLQPRSQVVAAHDSKPVSPSSSVGPPSEPPCQIPSIHQKTDEIVISTPWQTRAPLCKNKLKIRFTKSPPPNIPFFLSHIQEQLGPLHPDSSLLKTVAMAHKELPYILVFEGTFADLQVLQNVMLSIQTDMNDFAHTAMLQAQEDWLALAYQTYQFEVETFTYALESDGVSDDEIQNLVDAWLRTTYKESLENYLIENASINPCEICDIQFEQPPDTLDLSRCSSEQILERVAENLGAQIMLDSQNPIA